MTGCDVIGIMVRLLDERAVFSGLQEYYYKGVGRGLALLHKRNHPVDPYDAGPISRVLFDEIGVMPVLMLESPPCQHFSRSISRIKETFTYAKVVRKAAEQDTGFDKFFGPKHKGRYEAGKSSKLNNRERSKKKRQSKKKGRK